MKFSQQARSSQRRSQRGTAKYNNSSGEFRSALPYFVYAWSLKPGRVRPRRDNASIGHNELGFGPKFASEVHKVLRQIASIRSFRPERLKQFKCVAAEQYA
jgi:hypothetical protein